MVSADAPAYLVLDPDARLFPLNKDEITIGRTPESDICLGHEQVSRRHATLSRHGAQVLLTDVGSSNGTFVNGARVQGTVELHDGDRVRFASVEGVFHGAPPPNAPREASVQPNPVSFHGSHQAPPDFPTGQQSQPATAAPRPGSGAPVPAPAPRGVPSAALDRLGDTPILLGEGEVTVGRVPGNDIILEDSKVSSRHARIVNQEGDFFILDLESSNGTYINGRRIEEPWLLEQGDQVVLGDTEFIFRRLSKLARRRKGAPRPPGARPTRPGPKT